MAESTDSFDSVIGRNRSVANRNSIFGTDRVSRVENIQKAIRNIVDINNKGVRVRYISHYNRPFVGNNLLFDVNDNRIQVFDDVHMETGTKLSLDKLQVRLEDEEDPGIGNVLAANTIDGDVTFSNVSSAADLSSLFDASGCLDVSCIHANTITTKNLYATDYTKFGSNSIEISGGEVYGDINVTGKLTSKSISTEDISTVDLVATGNSQFGTNTIRIQGGDVVGDIRVRGTMLVDSIKLQEYVPVGRPIITVNDDGLLGYASNITVKDDVVKISSDLLIEENLVVRKEASIDSNVSISGNVGISGNLDICGYVGIIGNLDVCGNVDISNNLFVRSDVYLDNGLGVSGDIEIDNNLFVRNSTVINSNLFVDNDTIVSNNLYVKNDTIIDSNVIINNQFRIIGGEISGNLYINDGYLNVSGEELILKRTDISDAAGLPYPGSNLDVSSLSVSDGINIGNGSLDISGDDLYINGIRYPRVDGSGSGGNLSDFRAPTLPDGADLSNGYILMAGADGQITYVPNMYVTRSGIEIDGNLYVIRKAYAKNFITMSIGQDRESIENAELADYEYYLGKLMSLLTPDSIAFNNITIGGNLNVEGYVRTPLLDASAVHTERLCLDNSQNALPGNPLIAGDSSGCVRFALDDFFNEEGLHVTGNLNVTDTITTINVDASDIDASHVMTNQFQLANGQTIVPGNPMIVEDSSGHVRFGTDAVFSEDRLDLCGNLVVDGKVYTRAVKTMLNTSDMRVKQNIRSLEKPDYEYTAEKFMSLPMYEYEYKPEYAREAGMKEGKKFNGFMAQEFEVVYPDSITELTNNNHANNALPKKIKSIDMTREFLSHDMPVLLRYLIEENRDLKNRLRVLEEKVNKE